MGKWILATLLLIGVHFAASYLVPLDRPSQAAFGGLLRWAWPWSEGDGGPLGRVTVSNGVPFAGLVVAMSAATMLLLATLGVLGWWVPAGWWRGLAMGGAVALIVLMLLFFSPTKVLPIALALAVIAVATDRLAIPGLCPPPNPLPNGERGLEAGRLSRVDSGCSKGGALRISTPPAPGGAGVGRPQIEPRTVDIQPTPRSPPLAATPR